MIQRNYQTIRSVIQRNYQTIRSVHYFDCLILDLWKKKTHCFVTVLLVKQT